ncbi:MAG TPA: SDR family oxidoreductase [Steroidobacteraceae bacterium]|nr:SDR family oxidoreductase [Steroidobacteraceae bacterium]
MVDNPFQLHGTFLVTGGTRGIGRAISEQFARSGAQVIANYVRNEKAALELKSGADQEGLPIALCRADLTTPEGLGRIETQVKETGTTLAGIVHCAATGTHRPIDSLTGRHLDWTFALNARSLFELVVRLLDRFDRPSSILAISSLGGTHAIPHYTAVGASKGALEALVRHLAAELAPRGIRANVLAPGAVSTEAWKAIPDAEARLAEAARRSPIGRLVMVGELALCAQFLCSAAASGINGQTLVVDGGTTIVA